MPPSKSMPATTPPTDAILPMTSEYMQQIVRGEKTYEFRRYRIAPSVQRVWFYLTAPHSAITYVCEIDGGRTRDEGDAPLPEDEDECAEGDGEAVESGASEARGQQIHMLGNREFNTRHPDWEGCDYAYRVRNVRALNAPIGLSVMKARYGMKAAPRGLVYVPENMKRDVDLEEDAVLVWWANDDGKVVREDAISDN